MTGADALEEEDIRGMALSIRKRHLLFLLRQIKAAKAELREVTLARQRRARLIRLARSRGFKHCLKRLRDPGMTLQSASGLPAIEYDSTVRCYCKQNMLRRLEDLRRNCREWREQSSDHLAGNLRAVLEEGELLDDSPPCIRFTVAGVELDHVWIGDLEVTLSLSEFDVRVSNLSADASSHNGHPHPHVNTNGAICWGEHEATARAFHAAGDFLPLRDLIENLLRTYNSASPYISLEDWVDGPREKCHECSERCDSDDLAFSQSLDDFLCEYCRRYCEHCNDYVRDRDYDTDLDACIACVERNSGSCRLCGEQAWKRDLKRIEIETDNGTETVSVCESCRDDRRKEENDEDCSDPPCLLASAMDGAPDAVRGFLDGTARPRKGGAARRGFHTGAAGGERGLGSARYGLVGGKAA
jgi:hypothetical protein